MHALRKYVQTQMDARGRRPADLVNASGISKQVVSGLLADTRDHIDRMPSEKTITGLWRAFSIRRPVLLAVIGEAMGLPVDRPVEVADASRVSNDELIRELARRLGEAGGEQADSFAPRYAAGAQLARDQTAKPRPAAADREGVASDEAKIHTLNPRDQDDPAPPVEIPARNVGTPSRGQQLRDEQGRDAEKSPPPDDEE